MTIQVFSIGKKAIFDFIFVLSYICFMKKKLVCTIDAPCKINLHLAVGEKRPDGFHDLESLFVPLAFHDTLRLECGGRDGECSLEMNWDAPPDVIPPVIPMEKNLVFQAVSLFRERTGFKSGLFVRLDKRVPVGAGLGGGSSDAVSCLLALNALAGDVLSTEELEELAAVLGSDVPFFLNRGTDEICPSAAFVSGRGELVKPVKTPQGLWVLLVKPDFPSDTAEAFRLLDQERENMSPLVWENTPAEVLVRALEGAPEAWPFYNDFLPVFLGTTNFTTNHTNKYEQKRKTTEFHGGKNTEEHGGRKKQTTEFHGEEFYHEPHEQNNEPHEQEKKSMEGTEGKIRRVKEAEKYREILTALKEVGAAFAGLSGAGSCCFGVFRVKETAEKAEKALGIPGNFVKLTFFLAQKTIPVLE